MTPTEPLPLHHSWPLFDKTRHFGLGQIIGPIAMPMMEGAGHWSCDLSDNRLTWSDPVYDLFDFPRGAAVTRADTLARYCEESRVVMERLRAYAIRYRRGFTIDLSIRPGGGTVRTMRLIAAPECEGGEVVRLHGLKMALP